MSAIGQLLMERGVAVSGSDLRLSALTDKLAAMGATISEGHAAGNVPADAMLLVATAAAGDDNPEIAEARRRGIPVMLRAEMVARLMEGKKVIAVAGAHGKTTTSSLIAFILSEAGRKPMYLLGGESIDLGGHASWGDGDECVVEADEYKRAFLEYAPAIAVITNVEPDHLDYYGTEAAYTEAFVDFARRILPGGTLFACWDDQGARYVSEMVEDPHPGRNLRLEGTLLAGHRHRSGEREASFTTLRGGRTRHAGGSSAGIHFVRNAPPPPRSASAWASTSTSSGSIKEFRGAATFRRVGEAGGILVMDDYAHHPTEVRATIATARTRFPETRLIGVYQPHTYSRIAYLWDEWTKCWDGLDELVVLETYAAREKPEAGRSAKDLATAIERPSAHYATDFDDAARQAVALAKAGDVIFTIGAGDVVEVGPKILELLR
jgi:UDP-N-acetylmuramate--alanine ligase